MERVLYPAIDAERAPSMVSVVFTSPEGTLAAIRRAAEIVGRYAARLRVIVPQVVPFPRDLSNPSVNADFNEWQLVLLAQQVPVNATLDVYLCRDAAETVLAVLAPRSLVVVGGRQRRWWPSAEHRLADTLRRAGHDV